MVTQQIVNHIKNAFHINDASIYRGIGIECEIPIVTEEGKVVPFSIVQEMFAYLGEIGFELKRDSYAGMIVAAKRKNEESQKRFDYCMDTVTTDVGYGIIEVVLAPQDNLHAIEFHLSALLFLLTNFFKTHHCLMLGYGIQPLATPSRKLLMPKERYIFFEKFSTHQLIPKSRGADSSFLTITASNQCHIEIDLKDTITATNTLNALSGLQIALHANSPIWQGQVDKTCKANREILWDVCFPNRSNQIGIPPQFETIEDYIDYLFQFKPLLVKRNGRFVQILNKNTFKDFLLDVSPTLGRTLNNVTLNIKPQLNDINQLIPFSWFNARLVPKYGTIESRMCCQQPPTETLTSAALTLGIIENLAAAQSLASTYSLATWRKLRVQAAQHTINASIDGKGIVPLLQQLLDIAKVGLQRRNLQEEIFLQPLYERLQQRKSPADVAIEIFNNQGFNAFLTHISFKKEAFTKHLSNYSLTKI